MISKPVLKWNFYQEVLKGNVLATIWKTNMAYYAIMHIMHIILIKQAVKYFCYLSSWRNRQKEMTRYGIAFVTSTLNQIIRLLLAKRKLLQTIGGTQIKRLARSNSILVRDIRVQHGRWFCQSEKYVIYYYELLLKQEWIRQKGCTIWVLCPSMLVNWVQGPQK